MEGENLRKQPPCGEEEEKNSWDIKHYCIIALVVFVTFCCCILFFFMLYRYNGFTDFWKQLTNILQPIIIGLVLAYLLNPVVKFLEGHLLPFFEQRMKGGRKAKKTARGIAIAGALVFLVGVIALLMAAIVPSMMASIAELFSKLPEEINNLMAWIEEFTAGDTDLAEFAGEVIETASSMLENFWNENVLSQAQAYISSITNGVIYGVKFLINILVGLIVSVYVLVDKEMFAGRAKKLVYALFKPVRANVIVDTVRKSNEIFGGFISGKLLDSAIIGVITYIVLAIMGMPDTILVAVIVGVTNIIPFFGPFIGAVPSFLIIVLQNPIQGLYFLVFVVVLQQIDGNIIGPKILGSSTGLSSFWVVFAILVFGGLWGFLGMLLGVPIMAVLYYIAQKLIRHFLKRRGLSQDTESYIDVTGVDRETNQLIYAPPKEKTGRRKRKWAAPFLKKK